MGVSQASPGPVDLQVEVSGKLEKTLHIIRHQENANANGTEGWASAWRMPEQVVAAGRPHLCPVERPNPPYLRWLLPFSDTINDSLVPKLQRSSQPHYMLPTNPNVSLSRQTNPLAPPHTCFLPGVAVTPSHPQPPRSPDPQTVLSFGPIQPHLGPPPLLAPPVVPLPPALGTETSLADQQRTPGYASSTRGPNCSICEMGVHVSAHATKWPPLTHRDLPPSHFSESHMRQGLWTFHSPEDSGRRSP